MGVLLYIMCNLTMSMSKTLNSEWQKKCFISCNFHDHMGNFITRIFILLIKLSHTI